MAKTTQGVQHPAIRHATLQITALYPHPRNYKTHPEPQRARIAASLRRFGQVRSIVVQEGANDRYLIVAGHGLVEAARAESMTELHADIIPATWTSTQIEGYLIADNETAYLAETEETLLAELLQEQANAGYDLESLGRSQAELDALLAGLADEADRELPEFQDVDESVEDDLPTEMCQQCGKLCLKPGAKPPKS